MKFIIITAALLLALANGASADLGSQIDSCESSGEQSCVFNILRDLVDEVESAKNPGNYKGDVKIYKFSNTCESNYQIASFPLFASFRKSLKECTTALEGMSDDTPDTNSWDSVTTAKGECGRLNISRVKFDKTNSELLKQICSGIINDL